LREMGLPAAMKAGGYNFLDPDDGKTGAAKDETAHKALTADYYLTSVNAIAASGELVSADGYGNRVAPLIFGPKHVIVVAGINKVVPTVDAAVLRARTYAAQMTVMLFRQDYPSFEELAEAADSACSHLVITKRSTTKGRISVVLVGERLGF
jgi:L-lactate utilization protein LutB